jgi:hypothetical protein
MVRLIVTLFVFAMLACGGSDTGDTGAVGGEQPAAESASAPDMPTPAAKPAATPEPAASTDPKVLGCLELIRKGRYEGAVPICLAALEVDPDNQQVQDALAKAKAEAAKMAAAKAASQAAGEGAAEQASSKLGEAAGAVPDMPGQ